MSDDLEREPLTRASRAAWDVLNSPDTPGMNVVLTDEQVTDALHCTVLATQAALLSFLDMDEAGKERLREAVRNIKPERRWDGTSHTNSERVIDAVLSELRKMAGGCAHERVDHNGECLDCDEPT